MDVKLICMILAKFNDSLNVTTDKMDAIAIFETAKLITTGWATECVEDLFLCLREAKNGKYGKLYNRIDTLVIMEFWRQYLDEKYKAFDSNKISEKNQYGDFRTEMDTLLISQEKKRNYESDKMKARISDANREIGELNNEVENLKKSNKKLKIEGSFSTNKTAELI